MYKRKNLNFKELKKQPWGESVLTSSSVSTRYFLDWPEAT